MTKKIGAELILEKAKALPDAPGVYRMLGAGNRPLYVGKARALKKRVLQYTKPARQPQRIARMISLTHAMEFILTDSEPEALLLEAQLIKKLKPPFNILLRDDKSFPLIELNQNHEAARLSKYREQPRKKRAPNSEYFGPFVSASAVDRTLIALQRAFLLRSCTDNVYANRHRPCLLYQIKRCSAPCTGEIGLDEYQTLAEQAKSFLRGRNRDIHKKITAQMDEATEEENYELAALYRDRLKSLQQIQSQPGASLPSHFNADIFALHREDSAACIQLFIFRSGQSLGNRAWFPKHHALDENEKILESFIAQFYDSRKPPPAILINLALRTKTLLAQALSLKAQSSIKIETPQRGKKKALLDNAQHNAAAALARHRAEVSSQTKMLKALAKKLALKKMPARIEIYDNSHIQTTDAVGAMVVANQEGLSKPHYRIFNIKMSELEQKDDTSMMGQVFERRFNIKKDKARQLETLPDLIILDGGKGQVKAVQNKIAALNIPLLGIAKGPEHGRKRLREGLSERFFFCAQPKKTTRITELTFPNNDPLLYYLQSLRDEAHRFAISRHRASRKKSALKNPLDDIVGIGAKRKRQLLARFGSAKAVARASEKELESVQGISKQKAKTIYEYFHE